MQEEELGGAAGQANEFANYPKFLLSIPQTNKFSAQLLGHMEDESMACQSDQESHLEVSNQASGRMSKNTNNLHPIEEEKEQVSAA